MIEYDIGNDIPGAARVIKTRYQQSDSTHSRAGETETLSFHVPEKKKRYTYIYIYISIHIDHIYIYIFIYIHIYIYIYISIYIHGIKTNMNLWILKCHAARKLRPPTGPGPRIHI